MRLLSLVLLVVLTAFALGCRGSEEGSYRDREANPAFDDPAAGTEDLVEDEADAEQGP